MKLRDLALGLVLMFSGAAAQAGNALYTVTGVAADDVLNIRDQAGTSGAILGGLAPGQGGVEVIETTTDGGWGRIVYAEANGWVSMRFLALEQELGTSPPSALACSGTEPFWMFQLQAGQAFFQDFSTEGPLITLAIDWFEPLSFDDWGVSAAAMTGFDGQVGATFAQRACSDGMSDRTYGWQTLISLDGGARQLRGCCSADSAFQN